MEKINDKCEVFNWQEYLDLCKASDVPHTLFKHVEQSLDRGFSCGMAVEVPFKSKETTTYWPAVITKICGPLITLKYIGSDSKDKNSEIWSDINSLCHFGYSASQGIELKPPPCLSLPSTFLEDPNSIETIMKDIPIVPKQVLDEGGKTVIDRISSGMIVGIRDVLDPYLIKKAEIVLHVGGRLFLKMLNDHLSTIWLFYTDYRIVEAEDCTDSLRFPSDLIMKHPKVEQHSFELGMQLEMLNPKTRSTFHNGIVSKIIDKYYFIVSLVDKNGEYERNNTVHNSWLCSIEHPYIFPIGWCSKHDLQILQSNDIDSERCTYKEMFSAKSNAETLGFEVGMKLEAVHPQNADLICAATIKSVHEHLLCIAFDHEEHDNLSKLYYVHCNSNDIFPIYWCGTNNYELINPSNKSDCNITPSSDEDLGPIIYFNYKCKTGPMHSHKKISQLPKSVGPGEVSQVLKKVLNLIVSEAYQPLRILRILECEDEVPPGRTLVELKASNYNSNKEKVTYRANVDVVTKIEDVAEYCREVCTAIQACPYLFGPLYIGDNCPENCAGDKNGNGNDKHKPVKHKRRKRKGLHFKTIQALAARRAANQLDHNNESDSDSVHTSEPTSRPNTPTSTASAENENGSPDTKNSNTDLTPDNSQKNELEVKLVGKKGRKRKHNSHSPPPQVYEMKTRGAKLPNFKLQMKQAHWDKKDVESIYKISYRSNEPKKKPRYEYITESDSNTSGNDEIEGDAILNSEKNSPRIKDEIIEFSGDSNDKQDFSSIQQINIKSEDYGDSNDKQDFRTIQQNNIKPQYCDDELYQVVEKSRTKFNKSPSPPEDDDDLLLYSNPLHWSVDELYNFLLETDCCDLADQIREELIDGQAFMMLDLPFVQKFLNLRLEPALKLCEHVARIKLAFFLTYGN